MNRLAFIYTILLFVIYQIMFKITGFSVNTAVYGLFAILIFFYYSTDNLQFERKSKQNPIFVNIIIFMIFLFFYKNISIFTVFLVFSVCQIVLYRIMKKLSYGKDNRYTPKFFNERNKETPNHKDYNCPYNTTAGSYPPINQLLHKNLKLAESLFRSLGDKRRH